ncbi:MAG: UDP-glucose--hexose-1-phosphate uridylyltransferase [Acidobacteria bacterium]|nr:UDP-glucose--hexose-1-phosphate uridylyltransferase [Acidobacteriota bacterium]MBI3261548.1 UDP-glucose--hexose-1-phosphate uridylyltransferase [Acidobacteriota bacterium]
MSGLRTPHRRYNPLTREWVLVSPQRLERPWLGRIEPSPIETSGPYDPACYLCPGNARAGTARNPTYATTFVFDNDYPALTPWAASEPANPESRIPNPDRDLLPPGLLAARAEAGICRVVCFSPRHDVSVPRMTVEELGQVVDVWVDQFGELGALPWVAHVQIFENRGAAMGASNLHPHCQIWASATIPGVPEREQLSLGDHCSARGSCLLCDYLAAERDHSDRVVCANDLFTAVVPFWAVWPFEMLVVSNRHATGLDELLAAERLALADILKRVTTRYDNLFEAPCPYSMGFHQRPTDGRPHAEWHLHAHFYPPVLRSATVNKFMVGYELLATPQRDLTAEIAATRLREVGEVHYRDRATTT